MVTIVWFIKAVKTTFMFEKTVRRIQEVFISYIVTFFYHFNNLKKYFTKVT